MDVPRIFIEILWLIFSWIIWLLLKWRNWPRPGVSIMLIYSTAIGISFLGSWRQFNACMKNPLCDPAFSFSLLPFLAEVSFWLIILYIPIALAIKPKIIFDQRRNWWIALLVIGLAVGHIFSEKSVGTILAFTNLITTAIFFIQ